MIRECKVGDVEEFADLGCWFYATLHLPGTFNRAVFIETWRKLIHSGAGMILGRFVAEHPLEAIGCALYPDIYTGDPSAATAFWFREQTSNGLATGLLHSHLEENCRMRGIKHLFISVMCNQRFVKVSDFLSARGYQLAEMHYRKAL